MPTDLTDKVALVTGAASGLGSATARALAEAGAVVVAADIDEEGGRAIAGELGGHFVAVDVRHADHNRAAVAFAEERAGGLDLAFLNAGVSTGCGVLEDFDEERYRRANGVNLDGVVFGTHAAVPAIRRRGGGAIVATASLAGLTPMTSDPVYTANKHAVVGFARAMALVLEPENIRFNAVCPGFAESRIIDDIREHLAAAGLPIIPAERVAEAALTLFAGDSTGEAVVVQAGRDPLSYEFRGVPGPRPAPS